MKMCSVVVRPMRKKEVMGCSELMREKEVMTCSETL
jgi:hypothetical protein